MRQMWRFAAMTFILSLGLSTLAHAGVVTFDFEADITGTTTQFTDTISGLSATFSSTPDAGGFTIMALSGFQSLTGNILIDTAPETLTIAFSAPLTDISMDFATFGPGTASLTHSLGDLVVRWSAAIPPAELYLVVVLTFLKAS